MNIAQIALCTTDLPRTVRIFVEALGFANAGGRPRWGTDAAQIQELPSGDDTSVMMWWLVGRQDFVQIELFHHTVPEVRTRRPHWTPADLGWTRFGVSVPDFDQVLRRLEHLGCVPLSDPVLVGDSRRVCFREPGTDTDIEIIEEVGAPVTAEGAVLPAVAYATASVSDLDDARRFFAGAFGLEEVAADSVHHRDHEAMWGLGDAVRTCAVFRARDVLLEVVQYESPVPKPPAEDQLLSDQGMMNIAIGYRDGDQLRGAYAAAQSLGASASTAAPELAGGVYLRILDRLSLELLLVPAELDASFGFVAHYPLPPGMPVVPETVAV